MTLSHYRPVFALGGCVCVCVCSDTLLADSDEREYERNK